MLSSIRHTAHLLFALSFATTIFASERVVQVPLTDPNIVLGGHTQYNASLCGGGISLPTIGDSLAFQFNGSDIQLDFVVLPKEDNGNFTAWPDEAVTSSGDSTPWDHPQSLNCTFRRSTSFSSSANYQLRQGVHTLNLTNIGASYGGGGILVVGISYFPDPLPSTFEIWAPESQRPGNGTSTSKSVILGAAFASVIGFGLLAGLGEYLHRRYRRNRQAKNALADSVELNNLGSDGTTPNDQKPTVSRSGYSFSRWLDSLFRVV